MKILKDLGKFLFVDLGFFSFLFVILAQAISWIGLSFLLGHQIPFLIIFFAPSIHKYLFISVAKSLAICFSTAYIIYLIFNKKIKARDFNLVKVLFRMLLQIIWIAFVIFVSTRDITSIA